MAETRLSVQRSVLAGLGFTRTNANADGHAVANARNDTLLLIKNGGVSPITATVEAQQTNRAGDGTFPPVAQADQEIELDGGAEVLAGPFPGCFNDSSGDMHVTFSGVTSVTVAAIQPGSLT